MTSEQSLADAVVAALAARGVARIFGVPGGGSSLDIIEAAGRRGLDFVLTRGETAAALMAAVSAELSAAPGVALTAIGPGVASAVNGIAYAFLERAPVVLISDAREPGAGEGGAAASLHQVFDQQAVLRPLTKASCRLRPEHGVRDLHDLLDCALAEPPGPVHIDLSATHAGAPLTPSAEPPAVAAGPASVEGDREAALSALSGARRPVVIAGLQARARGLGGALGRLVEALGCPLLTSYKAKGVMPDDHAQVIGHFTGARAEAELLAEADLAVSVGLDPVELIPAPWALGAPLLVLSSHAGLEFPVAPAAELLGPLPASVELLAEAASRSDWAQAQIAALARSLRARVRLTGAGHTAETVVEAAAASAPKGARVTVDAGAHMVSVMALWRAEAANDVLKSNGLSTMGHALPAAIASALAEPTRPVIAFTGDAGLMMCLAELSTAARLGCRLTVVVLNDAALSLIDIKQQRQQRPSSGVRYPALDFAAAARGLGCRAWTVGRGEPVEPALRAAFAEDGPTLVDVRVDASGYGAQLAALRG